MSNSYEMVVARSVDILACTWIWRDYDMTISSMAGLELRKPAPKKWALLIGRDFLERLWPGHCEKAILADLARAIEAQAILSGKVKP